MTRKIDFYFEFPSPYSYLAHTQLPRITDEHGATVAYHPFRIIELMKIVGNRPTTIECSNKSKYAGADLQRWTKRYAVDFARNPNSKSFDFAELDRGALVAIEDGSGRRIRDSSLRCVLGQAERPLPAFGIDRRIEQGGPRRPTAARACERRHYDRQTGIRNEGGSRARGVRRTNDVRWRSDVLRQRPP